MTTESDTPRLCLLLPELLSCDDLIHVLNFSEDTVRILREDRSFPLIEIGSQAFILRESFIDWLQDHERSRLRNRRTGGVA